MTQLEKPRTLVICPELFVPIGFDPNLELDYIPELTVLASAERKQGAPQMITPETLHAHMQTEAGRARLFVLDCRFPYEFDGGHI